VELAIGSALEMAIRAKKKAVKKAAVKKSAVKKAAAVKKAEVGAAVQEAPVEVAKPAATLSETAKRRLVQTLIKQTAERLEQEMGKSTLADLIRLLNLEKEMGQERPSKIIVEWIDPRTGKPWKPNR
jgi:dGTP triphosphohydrolase